MVNLSNTERVLLRLDYLLAKQEAVESPVPSIEREEPVDDPRAEKFEFEEKPVAEQAGEDPGKEGKVRTKIYELVHRGGRTFERGRTAWVNPHVAEHLEQRKKASDWIRMLGNYLPIYFVGGYVRDKFFKKVSHDIDLVTLVSLEEAKKVLTELNIPFKEKSNSHCRLQFDVGGMQVDLISTTGDELLNNLRNRDYTINSIAQSVTGQFYDPTRGMEDIKLKLLRTPNNESSESFKEDPVRILRGARFLSDFPIKAHHTIIKGMKDNVDALSNVKKKRLGYELIKILSADKCWIGLKFLADYDHLKHISPELAKEAETKQRGKTHGQPNVWKHTLAALKHANSSDPILNLAILFHDVGKIETADEKNEHFPKHDIKGAEITARVLADLQIPKGLTQRISNMVRHHLFVSKVGPKGDTSEYKKLSLALGGDVDRFFKLAEADGKDHKNYKPGYIDSIKKRMSSIESEKPDKAGAEELKKSYSVDMIDESISIILGEKPEIMYIDELLKMVYADG